LIGIPDPESALFWQIAVHHEFHPANFQATDILPVLPERMKKFVRVVEKANTLVVDAPQRQATAILERLNQIDQPVPQVMLEAIVCIVSPECKFRFGLDWNHAVNVNGSDPFSLGIQSLGISGSFSRGGAKQAFDDFAVTSAFVRLLAEHGYLAIRASPRVMAKNGEKANISISRETFFSPQALSTGGQNSTNQNFIFQQNIQKVDTGIVLDIVPQIRGDDVTFQIEKAEVSEDVRASATDLANPYPVISRRSVSTTVNVRDGKTVVIGGLVQRQSIEQVSHIPGFSKLPLIGNAFKTIQRQERDAEVVIFISPRIVMPSGTTDRTPTASLIP
jgi:type II secretory pathway component GspD/PulD (secretin)